MQRTRNAESRSNVFGVKQNTRVKTHTGGADQGQSTTPPHTPHSGTPLLQSPPAAQQARAKAIAQRAAIAQASTESERSKTMQAAAQPAPSVRKARVEEEPARVAAPMPISVPDSVRTRSSINYDPDADSEASPAPLVRVSEEETYGSDALDYDQIVDLPAPHAPYTTPVTSPTSPIDLPESATTTSGAFDLDTIFGDQDALLSRGHGLGEQDWERISADIQRRRVVNKTEPAAQQPTTAVAETETAIQVREATVATREDKVLQSETDLQQRAADLQQQSADLIADRAGFEARVAAVQLQSNVQLRVAQARQVQEQQVAHYGATTSREVLLMAKGEITASGEASVVRPTGFSPEWLLDGSPLQLEEVQQIGAVTQLLEQRAAVQPAALQQATRLLLRGVNDRAFQAEAEPTLVRMYNQSSTAVQQAHIVGVLVQAHETAMLRTLLEQTSERNRLATRLQEGDVERLVQIAANRVASQQAEALLRLRLGSPTPPGGDDGGTGGGGMYADLVEAIRNDNRVELAAILQKGHPKILAHDLVKHDPALRDKLRRIERTSPPIADFARMIDDELKEDRAPEMISAATHTAGLLQMLDTSGMTLVAMGRSVAASPDFASELLAGYVSDHES